MAYILSRSPQSFSTSFQGVLASWGHCVPLDQAGRDLALGASWVCALGCDQPAWSLWDRFCSSCQIPFAVFLLGTNFYSWFSKDGQDLRVIHENKGKLSKEIYKKRVLGAEIRRIFDKHIYIITVILCHELNSSQDSGLWIHSTILGITRVFIQNHGTNFVTRTMERIKFINRGTTV